MNRIIGTTLLIVFFCFTSMADGIDSLRNLTYSSIDSVRFDAYLRLAVKYRRTNQDSLIYYLQQAQTELNSLNGKVNANRYEFFTAQMLQQKAVFFQQSDTYDSAKLYYENALQLYKNQSNIKGIAEVLNNLGAVYEREGNYPEALEYYFHLMRLCDSANLIGLKARALINIGVVYNNQGNFDEAIKYYDQAVPLKREVGDKKGEALLYNNMGIVYYYQNNYKKVLEYFKRSLNIYREIGDLRSQSLPYFNIAEIYFMQNAYKEALYYYKKSYEIDKQLGERASEAETLSAIGVVYAEMGQFKDALRVQHEALRLLKAIGAKNKYADALQETGLTYELIGDYKNALKYFKQFKIMHDSVHNIRKQTQIAQIKEQYETEKKDQQIDLLQERNRRIELENEQQRIEMKTRQRISILSLVVASLVLLALVMIYRMYRHKKLASQMLELKNISISEKNKEIRDVVTRLEKALKSREILYANTTHELRTPLNIINGFTNLLKDETDPILRSQYVSQVKSSTNHLLRLIEDMLVISRIETGQFELVEEGVKLKDLANYLTDIFEVLAATKQIEFNCKIDRSCPDIVTIDPVRYFQVVSNLIDNAIKYTDFGGEVSVQFKYIDNRFLKVEVNDSGIGIAEEKKREIFDRYRRVKNSEITKADGAGLGLNIVQQLLDLFEGHIEVESNLGKGSVFTVIIPSEEAFHITYRYATVYDDVMNEKFEKGRILIAEDNISSAELIKQTLIVYNPELSLDFVHNGEDALSQIGKNTYDLLIIDIKMPILTGIEVVREIRAMEDNQNNNIPIIGISAQTDEETRKAAIEAGINEFVPKPYEPAVLILKIEELAAMLKKKHQKVNKPSKENAVSASFQISDKLNKIDEYLRDKDYSEAVKHLNTLQEMDDELLSEELHRLLNELEKEIATSSRDEKIGSKISSILNYWHSNKS